MNESESCDHGLTFDLQEARKILAETPQKSSGDAAVDFVMGPTSAVAIIRKRWPRGWFTKEKPCPKGCGGQVMHQTWESSCGGYVDDKFTCSNPSCEYERWVDGIDS